MSSNNVFQLTKEMSEEERRFFRRDYLKETENIPIYVRLYDFLKQKLNYNEEEVLNHLKPQLTKKNISYVKNYLFEQLMNSLIELEESEDKVAELNKKISSIKILRRKGLYSQALKIWNKAMVQAETLELIPIIFQLKEEYRKFQLYNNPKITYPELEFIHNSIFNNTNIYSHYQEYQELAFEVLLLRKKSHTEISEKDKYRITQLLELPLLSKAPESQLFIINHCYDFCKSTLHYLLNEKEAYNYALNNIIRWLNNETYIQLEIEHFLEVVYLFYYTAIHSNKHEELEDVMNKVFKIPITSISHNAYLKTLHFLALNRLNNRLGRYSEVKKLFEDNQDNIPKWCSHIHNELKRTLLLSIGVAYFALEQWDDSYYYVKQGLYLFNDKTRFEQIFFSQLFLCVIAFEKNDEYLFELQHRSSFQYFYKYKNNNQLSLLILKQIFRIFEIENKNSRKKLYSDLKIKIELLDVPASQRQIFNYFNIPGWIESKILDMKYSDWVIRKNANAVQ